MSNHVTLSICLETVETTPSFFKVEKFLETQGIYIRDGVVSGFLEYSGKDLDLLNVFDIRSYAYELIEFENESDANLFLLNFSNGYKKVTTTIHSFLDDMEPEQYQHPEDDENNFILCFSNWLGSRRRFFELAEFKENQGILMKEIFI